jgi:hypothetical protein
MTRVVLACIVVLNKALSMVEFVNNVVNTEKKLFILNAFTADFIKSAVRFIL